VANTYSISDDIEKNIKWFYTVYVFLLVLTVPISVSAQSELIGPGIGSFEDNYIIGQFINWDRNATPKLVLRVHGASMLQTFSDISSNGEFKLPLPEIPVDKNFGTLYCGEQSKGSIVVATDISLLTNLPGFTSPGKWDKGFSEIGMAIFADEEFSKNIGKPGGKRGQWLYSKVARIVEAGECNNSNSFQIEIGWNAFTVVSGTDGGPHTYNPGFDDDLGWYWYAFPEDIIEGNSSNTIKDSIPDENSEQPITKETEVNTEWLLGEWNGVQVDTHIQIRLQSSGDVWLESIENGNKKTMEGKWSLNNREFVLDIEEGMLQFNIEQISDKSFRLFGKDAGSDIVFTKKD
jgi:hypothetical protein